MPADDDALFEAQMRSLDVRPAHAERGGRGRPSARGERRDTARNAPPDAQGALATPPEDDAALFLRAIAALDPPSAGQGGKAVAAAPTLDGRTATAPGPVTVGPDLRAEDALFVEAMERLGDPPTPSQDGPDPYDDGLTVGATGREQARRVVGTPKALRRRIRSGELQPDAELDLHGQRRDEARRALASFLRTAVASGHEVLRIIVGRGLHSAEGPVLRDAVHGWLTRDHRQVVAEVVSAPPAYGGEGVWYAFLRRFS